MKKRGINQKQKFLNLIYILIIVFVLFLFFKFSSPIKEVSAWTKTGTIYNCSSCSDCNSAITNASAGDIVQLNISLSDISGTCIDFNGKDNIIFDCLGNTIGGDWVGGIDYGIYFRSGSNNNTVRNCNITKFSQGTLLVSSYNNTINNLISNYNNGSGVYLESSSNNILINITSSFDSGGIILVSNSNSNTLINITSNSNSQNGVYIYSNSHNTTLTNITSNSNSKNGVYILLGSNNTLTNLLAQENGHHDFYFIADEKSQCNNNFTNMAGSGNRPMEYYNYSTTVQNKELSMLILCNADDSIINNVTVKGSDSLKNNGIIILQTENATFSNIISSKNYNGIYFRDSANNTLTNITTSNSNYDGISMASVSNNNVLKNITTNSNLNNGINIGARNNTIYSSRIENNTNGGIYLSFSNNNSFYNNLLNNTKNLYYDSGTNYFNTTKTLDTNIMKGPYIGGNYWAYPNGTGFSETCTDSDSDGICDSSYNIEGTGNYDYLPLSGCVESWTCTDWSTCSGGVQTRTCTDGNSCGTTINKPAISQSCTEPTTDGGGAVVTITPTYLEITPKEFNIRMAINTNQPEVIKIKNIGTSSRKISISQRNLDNLVILGNTSLELAPQETKYLNVVFVAPSEPGIYTGKILIDREEVLVTLNVKTKLFLFDSNIVVLNKDYKVARGEDLRTKVSLIPLGDEERMDVTLNYMIKDYEGKIYLRQTETILIEKKIDFKKDFATGGLPLGKYIVGLELVYPGGVAPSSANFEVVETLPSEFFGKLVLFLIISILVIAVIIIALLIRKKIGESR